MACHILVSHFQIIFISAILKLSAASVADGPGCRPEGLKTRQKQDKHQPSHLDSAGQYGIVNLIYAIRSVYVKRTMKMKVRVRDIAVKAGVSSATVSNALNGRPGVSIENAQMIKTIAEEMGYSVIKGAHDTAKRSYVRLVMFKRSGLVVMNTQFFLELIESIERECRAFGLELIITHIHIKNDADYPEQIQAICADHCMGVLLLGTEMEQENLSLFDHCRSPLLVLDNLFRHEKVNTVVMDNYDAGFKATSYLHAAGHTMIGHITSSMEFSNMHDRRQGFEAVMTAHRLPVDENSFWRVAPTLEGAYHDMKELLESGRKLPTAFFAGNDIMAVGCVRALVEKGYSIPKDISIIGMDDLSICNFCMPPLTTIRVSRPGLGVASVRILLKLMKDMDCGIKAILSVELVERGSVAQMKQGL